jgi:microcompartment protein CcmL/EutN
MRHGACLISHHISERKKEEIEEAEIDEGRSKEQPQIEYHLKIRWKENLQKEEASNKRLVQTHLIEYHHAMESLPLKITALQLVSSAVVLHLIH